jgi:hypothetical protein
MLYTERQAAKTTGLDAGGVRAAQSGYPQVATADPQMPIPSKSDNRLTLDLEGLVLNDDGTYVHYQLSAYPRLIQLHRFWVSDEYGPYTYRFDSTGALIQTIQPPDAVVPLVNGNVNFTGEDDPDTGRAANKGKNVSMTDHAVYERVT